MLICRSKLRDQLHIFGLSGIAVAYPVFAFLLANPAYLVANRVTSHYLWLIIAILIALVPLVLACFAMAISVISLRAYRIYQTVVIGLLLFLVFLPLFSQLDFAAVWVVFLLSAFLSLAVLREYSKNQFTYTGLLLLVPVVLFLTVRFAVDENIQQVLIPTVPENSDIQVNSKTSRSPVVLVVFDELPLVHLLDQYGDIDATRFPHFAALAATSTWYANASTVSDVTIKAVPAILTGLYPRPGRVLPVPKNYPQSLFFLLQQDYEMHIVESLTSLFAGRPDDVITADAVTVGSDILIFYLRSLLPTKAADKWLPLQGGIWGGFLSQEGLREWLKDNADWRRGDRAPSRRFESTVSYIEKIANYPANTFHYIHIALPHRPYNYTSSGRRYGYLMREDKISVKDMSQAEIDQGRSAHILQVGLADRIIGLFREQLIRLELWDETLLIVVADHGQDYRARTNNRFITRENLGNVAAVPLFIKYPGQDTATVDYSNVQTIDITPTVIDATDLSIPVMDGRSLVAKDAPVPSTKIITSESGEHIEISMAEFAQARAISHAEAVDFFDLTDERSDLYNYGRGLDLIGASLQAIQTEALHLTVEIEDSDRFTSVAENEDELPLFIQGIISNPDGVNLEGASVAIAINDIVWAVAQPYPVADGTWRFNKILPEEAFLQRNQVVAVIFAAQEEALKL